MKYLLSTLKSSVATGSLTNFDNLIYLDSTNTPDSFWAAIASNGLDIIPAIVGGTFYRDILFCDTTNKLLILNCRVDSYDTNSKALRLSYSNTPSASNPETYSTYNVFAPLNEVSSVCVNRANPGVNDGNVYRNCTRAQTAKIYKGINTVDATSYLSFSDIAAINSANAFEFSTWFKPTSSLSTFQIIFRKMLDSTHYIQLYIDSGYLWFDVYNGAGTESTAKYLIGSSLQINRWNRIACLFDGTQSTNATKLKIIIDATEQTLTFTGSMPATLPNLATADFKISDGTYGAIGLFEWVGISTTARGVDWQKTQYAIENAPKSAINVGTILIDEGQSRTNLKVGTTQSIHWGDGQNGQFADVLSNVKIELSRDAGATWTTLSASAPNTGSYSLSITSPETTDALIRISGLIYTNPDDASTIDYTDIVVVSNPFSILNVVPNTLKQGFSWAWGW